MHKQWIYAESISEKNKKSLDKSVLGLCGSVLDLTELAPISPNRSFKKYMNDYFTFLKLHSHLSPLGHCATGTVRDNRLEDYPLRNQRKSWLKNSDVHLFANTKKVERLATLSKNLSN